MVSSAGTFCVTGTDLRQAIEVKQHLVQHLVEAFGQFAAVSSLTPLRRPDHEQVPFLASRHQPVRVLEGPDNLLELGAHRRVLDHVRVLKLGQEGADYAHSLIDLKALTPVPASRLRPRLDPVRNTDDLVNYADGLLMVYLTIRGSW